MASRKTAPSQTPSSMTAGGTSDTSEAMTAPGSVPEAAHEPGEPDEPAMASDRYDGRHLVHGQHRDGGAPAWRDASGA
jgi:hypothetical protein